MSMLFERLPEFPPSLSTDELKLLAALPAWDTIQEIGFETEAIARRLEKRGLVKIRRLKDDPIAIRPTMYAGKLPAAALTLVED